MKKALLINFVLVLACAVVETRTSADSGINAAMNTVGPLLCLPLLIFAIAYFLQKIKERNTLENIAARQVRKEAQAAQIAAQEAERQAKKEEEAATRQAKKRAAALERSRQARLRAQSKIIVEVKLLGAGMTVQKSGGLGGFVVGSMIAGPVGGAIGATSKRNFYQRERFAVKYSDGHVEIEEVVQDSNRYKELMKYVKWEDIQ